MSIKLILAFGLAALLGCPSLLAVSPPTEQAIDRIVQTMMPPAKQQESYNKFVDRIADKMAEKKFPPAGVAEVRTALRKFMDQLVDEGVLEEARRLRAKVVASQLREKLSEEEILTLATFLESSVGLKLVNKTIALGVDKELMDREMKELLASKKTEFESVMAPIFKKYGPPPK